MHAFKHLPRFVGFFGFAGLQCLLAACQGHHSSAANSDAGTAADSGEGSSEVAGSGKAGAGSGAVGSGGKAGAGSGGSIAGQSGSSGGAGAGTSGSSAGNGGAAAAGSGGAGSGAAGAGGSVGMNSVDGSAELFDPDKLPRFDITLSPAAISALTADPGTYVHAGLRYGTTTLNDVAVRIKGEASLRNLTQKAAFKIKIDEFVSGQTLLGLKRVTLNNMVQDPTFLSERLAYHVYRAAGLPAPRCNNALVYVNDELYGVYANIESEDKTFLRRHFSNADGNLYEDAQVDFEPGNEAIFTLQTNETANDRTDIKAFVAAIAAARDESFLADMDATLDTTHFLKWTAVEGAVNQWDEYSYTYFEPNNFRVYHDPASGKFTFLPWGMDLAMKPFVDGSLAYIPLFKVPVYENKPGNRDAGGLVFKRCLASPGCKSQYAQVLSQVADLYDAQKLDELAARYYTQIKDHVYEDFRKEYSNQEFETAYQALLGTIRGRTAAMRGDLKAAGF